MSGAADTLSVARLGPDRFCAIDETTGAAFRLDGRALRFLRAVRGGAAPGRAAQQAGLAADEAQRLAASLAAQGLLPGAEAAAAPSPPPELKLIFQRADLIDIGPLARALERVFGWVFSPVGLALWAVTVATALYSLAGESARLGAALADLARLDAAALAQIALGALGLKAAHELGHAVSLARFSRRAGQPPRPIRLGMTVFAFIPFPTTDCTAAWALPSRAERAWIALAGAHVESFIAAILALVWTLSPEGAASDALIRLVMVAGVSSLLFNLNPLLRLDGYFALSDLLDQPNLAGRAAQAAQRLGLRLLGADLPAPAPGLLAYWAASLAWRVTVFTALIWVGHAVHPAIGWAAAAIALSVLLIRPLIRLLRAARKQGGARPGRLALAGAGLAGLAALALVPLPDAVRLEARLSREEPTHLRAPEAGRLGALAQAGARTGAAFALDSPALALRLDEAALDIEALEAMRRGGLGRDPAAARRLDAELQRARDERAELADRLVRLAAPIPAGALWEPAPEAAAHRGGWLSPGDAAPLGRLAIPAPTLLRSRIPLGADPDAEALAPGDRAAFRPLARRGCVGEGQVRRAEAASGGVLLIEIAPDPASPCLEGLPSGSGVALRLPRPDASLAQRAARSAARLAQRAALRLNAIGRETG